MNANIYEVRKRTEDEDKRVGFYLSMGTAICEILSKLMAVEGKYLFVRDMPWHLTCQPKKTASREEIIDLLENERSSTSVNGVLCEGGYCYILTHKAEQ